MSGNGGQFSSLVLPPDMTLPELQTVYKNIPEMDRPATVFDELREEIRHGILGQPRNHQKMIGPSEIGEPCDRALIHKLAGHPEPREDIPFKAWVGTGIHSQLEGIFGAAPANLDTANPRYLLEEKVTCGYVNGTPLVGTCDCFDTLTGTVIDWKSKGKTMMSHHKRHGPGITYRVQAHMYGRGQQLAGRTPRTVMIVYLPRDGEFSDLFYWSEPYQEQIALAALSRASAFDMSIKMYGAEQVLKSRPMECDDKWCRWCNVNPREFRVRQTPTHSIGSTRELFAGLGGPK